MNKTEDPKQVRDMLVEAGDLMSYYHLQIALATLDRLSAPVGVPDGYALVPIEPTVDMMQAGSQVRKDESQGTWGHAACVYKSMIDAI